MESRHDHAQESALGGLSQFRQEFYASSTARADAPFELTNAVSCADGPVLTLVDLASAFISRCCSGSVLIPGMAENADSAAGAGGHADEPHDENLSSRLNWLRAGVLGANDGIVSTAGLVVGVAGATLERGPILTAGLAGLAAGAVAMALGEYVSVSSQRDSEKAMLAKGASRAGRRPAG